MKIPSVNFWFPHMEKSKSFMPVNLLEGTERTQTHVQCSTQEYRCNDWLFARVVKEDLAM